MSVPAPVHTLIQAALAAADPALRLAAHLPGLSAEIQQSRQVWVVGAGKAALEMALELHRQTGPQITGGAIACVPERLDGLDPALRSRLPFQLLPAAHPLPDERNLQAAAAIREVARQAEGGDLLVALLSGGGSAHLTCPVDGLNLGDLQRLTQALLRAGAPIEELNAVRKHLEQLKGGGLLRLAAPARVSVFILSDVLGDPLDVIASGPFAPDPTTYTQALQVLDRYGLEPSGPIREILEAGAQGAHPETLKPGDPLLQNVTHTLTGSNRLALDAVQAAAERLGYRVVQAESGVQGEARQVGQRLAELAHTLAAQPRSAWSAAIFGGETTVTVRGSGIGGRNLEMALAAALAIDGLPGVTITCFATDGIDGPTDAAGAWVTGKTCLQARRLGLDPHDFLERNDSYTFFSHLDQLILTGPTGTNVNDLAWVLVGG